MTALAEYARLESRGIWRADQNAQRRDVIVSFGDATLILTDKADRPLTHWSLPAIERLNRGVRPAIFSPDPDHGETLEIDDDTMIDALETIRRTVQKRQAHPGALRRMLGLAVLVLFALLVILVLPGALTRHTLRSLPASTRTQIDTALLHELELLTGPACNDRTGKRSLKRLQGRLQSGPIVVLPGELPGPLTLPGGTVVLDRAMAELPDDPAVTAGYVLQAELNATTNDPLAHVLDSSGWRVMLQLLTTGHPPQGGLQPAARALITTPVSRPDDAALIERFNVAQTPLKPWAYDIDISGESVSALIVNENGRETRPILDDGNWIALQSICENESH